MIVSDRAPRHPSHFPDLSPRRALSLADRVGAMTLVDVWPVEAGFLSIRLSGHQEVTSSGLGVLDGKVFARPHEDPLALPRPRAGRAGRGTCRGSVRIP